MSIVTMPMRCLLLVALLALVHGSIAQESTDAPKDEEPALNLDELLQEVKQGRVRDNKVNRQRMAEFRANKAQQQQRLDELAAEEARQEEISRQREAKFEEKAKPNDRTRMEEVLAPGFRETIRSP